VYELYFGTRSVVWSTGATTNAITINPVKDTTYSVTVSNGLKSCKDTVSFKVAIPIQVISGDTSALQASYNNTANTVDTTITVSYGSSIINARVTLSENQQAGDVLDIAGTLPSGVTKSYNSSTGVLTINGNFTSAQIEALFRKVTFATTAKTALVRKLSFSLGDAVPYSNDHFYEFVSSSAITWTAAKTAAAARSYYGKLGYLATATSPAENAYIFSKIVGDGWIGMSDDYQQINAAVGSTLYANQTAANSRWTWVTGPEAGQLISVGLTPNTVTQAGMYSNWAPNQPDGAGGTEHYGQLYAAVNGKWNDLPNTIGSFIVGYVVEYGGLPGDDCSNLTFTKKILTTNELPVVSTIANQTLCSGVTSAALGFTVSDVETSLSGIVVTATSSDQAIIPNSKVLLGGSKGNRTVTVTSLDSVSGSTIITLSVADTSGGITIKTFTVKVNRVPLITTTTPASRTDSGTVVLSANATAGTLNWYTIAVNGASIGTGANFTTPVIGITTTYYVDATDNGCTSPRIPVIATVDHTPVIVPNQVFTIDENKPNGTQLDSVHVTDADAGTV
jgi:hypothetical protein